MTTKALLLVLAANFLGGSAYFATAFALKEFTPAQAAFWRTFFAAVLFLPFSIRGLRRGSIATGDWLRMAAVGVFGYAAPLMVGNMGQDLSSATNASLLVAVEPISVIFLSAYFLGEAWTKPKVTSLVLSLFGSVLIVLQGIPFWNAQITPHFKGDALLFFHGFLWSLYTVIGKPVLRAVDPMTFTAITTVIAALPLAWAAGPWPLGLETAPLAPPTLAAVAYLAVFSTFLGTLTWNKALQMIPASQLANFIFLQPLVGTVSGVFLLKDSFTLWSACGGGLILLGLYFSARDPER